MEISKTLIVKVNKMEKKIIINDYQNLEKRPIIESFEQNIPPREMIDLLKEYLPIHLTVGTVWDRKKVQQFDETNRLKNACDEFRKKIMEFDFFGSITFLLNGEPVVVRIYYDEADNGKNICVSPSTIIDYKYEFQ